MFKHYEPRAVPPVPKPKPDPEEPPVKAPPKAKPTLPPKKAPPIPDWLQPKMKPPPPVPKRGTPEATVFDAPIAKVLNLCKDMKDLMDAEEAAKSVNEAPRQARNADGTPKRPPPELPGRNTQPKRPGEDEPPQKKAKSPPKERGPKTQKVFPKWVEGTDMGGPKARLQKPPRTTESSPWLSWKRDFTFPPRARFIPPPEPRRFPGIYDHEGNEVQWGTESKWVSFACCDDARYFEISKKALEVLRHEATRRDRDEMESVDTAYFKEKFIHHAIGLQNGRLEFIRIFDNDEDLYRSMEAGSNKRRFEGLWDPNLKQFTRIRAIQGHTDIDKRKATNHQRE